MGGLTEDFLTGLVVGALGGVVIWDIIIRWLYAPKDDDDQS